MLIAYEDKRFTSHHGVDPLALGARGVPARHARPHRLRRLDPHHAGGAAARAARASARSAPSCARWCARSSSSARSSKDEILALYLDARALWRQSRRRARRLARLFRQGAAAAVARPKPRCWWRCRSRRKRAGPTASRRPRSAARDRVLDRVAAGRPRAAPTRSRAPKPSRCRRSASRCRCSRRMPPIRRSRPSRDRSVIALTIDADLQKPLEELARERAQRARARHVGRDPRGRQRDRRGAARVSRRRTISTQRRAGQVDMTQALRSPGSTLKPFIYGLGFEDGLVHPETLIEDRPVRYGSYAPENFDLTFQGTVTVRTRAANVAQRAGGRGARRGRREPSDRAAARRPAATLVLPKGEVPGLAMGLGGVGVTLTDLTMLYAGLARGGDTLAADRAPRAAPTPAIAPAARSGRRLVCRRCADRHAAAGERGRRPHRLQDRHLLRLSRCLGGRLRRHAHHRRLGRPAGRRAGAGPGRPRRRRADPVRRLRALRHLPAPLPQAPKGADLRHQRPAAAAAAALPPAACSRRGARTAPRIMFPPNGARLELAGNGDPTGAQDRRRRAAADPAGQRRAAAAQRPAGARCSSSPTGRASCG